MFTLLKFRVGSGPRILSLRVYDRKLFISFHVQAVVPLMLVKPTDTSPLASANISPLTNIPTSLSTWKVLKRASVALFSSMCSVFCGRLISLIKSFFYLGLWMVNHGKKGESEEMEWENIQLHLSLSSSELVFGSCQAPWWQPRFSLSAICV